MNSGCPSPSGRLYSLENKAYYKVYRGSFLVHGYDHTGESDIGLTQGQVHDQLPVLGASSGVPLLPAPWEGPYSPRPPSAPLCFLGTCTRVTLHQPGVMDDLTRISGRITGSGAGETKNEASHVWRTWQFTTLIIVSLRLWQPPSQDGQCISEETLLAKSQIYNNDNKKETIEVNLCDLTRLQALKFFH